MSPSSEWGLGAHGGSGVSAPLPAPSTFKPSPHITRRYLEAIRRLKAEGKSFARTIHLSFVPGECPPEEQGGLGDAVWLPASWAWDTSANLSRFWVPLALG